MRGAVLFSSMENSRDRWALRRMTTFDEMKAEEYRYWQSRPAEERLRAITELVEEWYGATAGTVDESPLRRVAVRIKR